MTRLLIKFIKNLAQKLSTSSSTAGFDRNLMKKPAHKNLNNKPKDNGDEAFNIYKDILNRYSR